MQVGQKSVWCTQCEEIAPNGNDYDNALHKVIRSYIILKFSRVRVLVVCGERVLVVSKRIGGDLFAICPLDWLSSGRGARCR
jgi:hypothetical protein